MINNTNNKRKENRAIKRAANKLVGIIAVFLIMTSCKPTAKLTADSTLEPKAFKNVMNSHAKNAPNFKSISGRIRANFQDKNTNQSISLDYRIERGKNIWMSAKVLGLVKVANALITPDRVMFYDRINKQYFDGDFQLISQLVGIELDFEKLENLLYGQMLFNLEKKQVNAGSVSDDNFLFTTLVNAMLQQDVFIKASDYTIQSQQFSNRTVMQNLIITYPKYQIVDKKPFPKEIQLIGRQENQEIKILLEYRNVQVDETLSFPFSIPNGYTKIDL